MALPTFANYVHLLLTLFDRFVQSQSTRAHRGHPFVYQHQRLIVFFTHYGCLTDRWFPAKSHGPLTTSDYMAMQTLAPLAPYANKLLMVRGIRSMNEP